MIYLWGALPILCSCALGMILQYKFEVQEPSLHWFIGSMGVLAAFIIYAIGGK